MNPLSGPVGSSMIASSARGPSASLRRAMTYSSSWPGRVLMSRSTCALSGMTFTLTPPCTTLGEMVILLRPWRSIAINGCLLLSLPRERESSVGLVSIARCRRPRPRPSATWPRCSVVSGGLYLERRVTASLSFTTALSLAKGMEPWPGFPLKVTRFLATPFSPAMKRTLPGVMDIPPASETE